MRKYPANRYLRKRTIKSVIHCGRTAGGWTGCRGVEGDALQDLDNVDHMWHHHRARATVVGLFDGPPHFGGLARAQGFQQREFRNLTYVAAVSIRVLGT